jgi:hypothetical protein
MSAQLWKKAITVFNKTAGSIVSKETAGCRDPPVRGRALLVFDPFARL